MPKKMQDLKPFSPDYNKKCFLPWQKATSDTFSLLLITSKKIPLQRLVKSEEVKKYPRNKSEEFFCIEATKKIFLSFLNKVSNSNGGYLGI